MATSLGTGECDACPKTDVALFASPVKTSDAKLCANCYHSEVKALETGSTKWVDNALANAKAIDTLVELKTDIFVANTTAFTELRAAIQQDETIPQNKKNEAFVQACEARIKQFSDVIFADEQALNAKRNERYTWAQQTRQYIATLQEAEREKFKKYNIDYTPKSVTTQSGRTRKTKTADVTKVRKGKAFDKKACMEAANKYKVPMAGVQSLYISRPGMTYDSAAKMLAELMAGPPQDSAQ